MSKVRILYICHYSSMAGGGGVGLLNICKNIDKARFQVLCLFEKEGPLADKIRELGIEAKIMKLNLIDKVNIFPYLKSIIEAGIFLRQRRIRIIHFNTLKYRDPAFVAAKLLRIRTVLHVRSPERFNGSWLDSADRFIFNSIDTQKRTVLQKVRLDKGTVIYNGVDLESFGNLNGNKIRLEFGISHDTPLIGIIGKVRPVKGIEYFINMATEISKAHKDVRFLVAGGADDTDPKGTYFDEMKSLSKRLGLEGSLFFTGWRRDVASIINSLDILVLASIEEPFGRVLIEAGACRKPVVATKVGGVPEIVEDKITGILVPPKDTRSLISSATGLLKDKQLAGKMGEAARQRIEKKFDIRKQIKRIEDIYSELLKD